MDPFDQSVLLIYYLTINIYANLNLFALYSQSLIIKKQLCKFFQGYEPPLNFTTEVLIFNELPIVGLSAFILLLPLGQGAQWKKISL